jgi:hypothetical protein
MSLGLLVSGCAQLHHVQLSDISNRTNSSSSKEIDIKLSETGVNLQEIADIAKAFSRSDKSSQQIQEVQNIIALFQMGPVTGNPVYIENYWRGVPQMLEAECPSGRITGVTSIRETRKYPVVSGEIVRIKATCLGRAK